MNRIPDAIPNAPLITTQCPVMPKQYTPDAKPILPLNTTIKVGWNWYRIRTALGRVEYQHSLKFSTVH